ncbi:OmpA family protein [Qipengyuania sp. S6317L1]|uniref:OmpA family protein n=1 Tax=Qipengyuania sp. S6317L1 TaxID=2926410 RepID=UPI001FF37F12|nr:OmpA family protein [Qipengyuania sp. S6317L1]MCK0098566.1 OmpA family protein [Qipengyuania sp. S6317L1]
MMNLNSITSAKFGNRTLCTAAALSLPLALGSLAGAASAQEVRPVPSANGQTEVLTTVTAPAPGAFEDMVVGPDVEGFISDRRGNRVEVTTEAGEVVNVMLTNETSVQARGGFLGLASKKLGFDALLSGLPVKVDTRQWDGGLVAERVRFSGNDFETAQMIAQGTDGRFTRNEAQIEANAQAAEQLRGRFGDIDQYNVKSTTNVYFDTGRSKLDAQSRGVLCDAAARANQIDNALLLVVGYTDSTGSQDLNQRLSEKRAGAVVNYLQQQCGWAPYRMLTPTGMSESNPVADNSTAQGKAQNRRVAVNVLVSKSVDGFGDEPGRTARR